MDIKSTAQLDAPEAIDHWLKRINELYNDHGVDATVMILETYGKADVHTKIDIVCSLAKAVELLATGNVQYSGVVH